MSIDDTIATAIPCDLPFPDELLVALARSDLGLSDKEARDLARSIGWVEVPGGWRAPIQ